MRLEKTTDVIFTPQTKNITAKHDDQTYMSLEFRKYPIETFHDWVLTFMTNSEIAVSAQSSVEKVGAIDSDGFVPTMIIEGRFRTRKVAVDIKGDVMHFESLIPGLQEAFDWHSWIVNDANRAILKLQNGSEFFSLG